MDWTELRVTVPLADSEAACAIAQMVVGGGLYLEDYSDLEQQTMAMTHMNLIDEELLKKDRTHVVLHLYFPPEQSPVEPIGWLGDQLTRAQIEFSIDTQEVRELDWATAWKSYYHPIELSKRLAICPTWEQYDPKPGQQVIRLDPGMAFGTGTHETTRLCLSLLELYFKPGMSLLDVGTGSGILAICGKLLGGGRTVGVDIDEIAVRSARENAAENQTEIEFLKGDLATDVTGVFDLICANIVADAILRLAPDLPALMHDQSVCIVSGIIDTRRAEVEAGLIEVGLAPVMVRERNGWAAIACTLQSGRK
ncbi:MAG: 50S ribosomal protein L11 methyltransferase [Oscillospiraceae bacterium]